MDRETAFERLRDVARWDALRLPGSSRQALDALAARRDSGALALFHGPGRAGKTVVAGALAAHLGLTAYRADLARVVSTYLGETERNLTALFDAAPAGGGLLFLDEADALIGPRGGGRDAHDRYANLEIAYLLQRLEAWPGLAILATNALKDVAPMVCARCAAIVGIPRMRP